MNAGRAQLSRVYGVETWSVYDVLDESLAPSGPDSLHDLAGRYLKPGMRVLDAGCRDAAHLIRLIRRYGVTGVGVDPVEVHVERASAAVEERALRSAPKSISASCRISRSRTGTSTSCGAAT